MLDPDVQGKLERLRGFVRGLPGALVAFSGGADSALVLAVAALELRERAVALTVSSPSLPPRELDAARAFAAAQGVRHLVVEGRELEDPRYAANPADRCYYCKAELYALCERTARELSLGAIVDGFNADDRRDVRPGQRAAQERGVLSPLALAGLSKEEVRACSRALGLSTWDKPQAACLSSRLPTGTPVTVERLAAVGGAEEDLAELGFRRFRVRHHGDVARIELGADELGRLADAALRERLVEAIKRRGFRFVAVDLEPFESGRFARLVAQRV